MKNEITQKLKGKGIDPMKEKIDDLKRIAEVFSDNVTDYRK